MVRGVRSAPIRWVGRIGMRVGGRSSPFLVLLALAVASPLAWTQSRAPLAPTPAIAKAQTAATKPDWSELTPAQQAALDPLAPAWAGISEAQKRKWIALSQNYPSLSPAERETLHGRMSEWAALSPAQRNQARINFTQTKNLSTDEKKAQWEAYQALSPDQKKRLAAGAQPQAAGAALAVTPIAPNKLAAVPVTRSEASSPGGAASRPLSGRPAAPRPKSSSAASAPAAQR